MNWSLETIETAKGEDKLGRGESREVPRIEITASED